MAFRLRIPGPETDPIYRRIDRGLRDAIEAGKLKPGDRLPSVVDFAKDLKVNKLTVLKAFRALEQDGLLSSHVGRGTFVAGGEGAASQDAPATSPPHAPDVARALRRLRDGYARGLRDLLSVERRPGSINLTGGVPSPDSIPDGLLERLAHQALATNPRRLYAYGGPAGLLELRTSIARTLTRGGTPVTAAEVIVTNGSQQAMNLIAAWARDAGRSVLCETPTFTGTPGAFMLFGHPVTSVPWAGDRLDEGALRAAAGPGSKPLLYVCPDFHNPSGLTLDDAARHDIADWARDTDAFVVDDQIFRAMRFEGAPPDSLYGMLPIGRRFLVGSVSKAFMTGLRVGYLVADAALIAELLPYKRTMDLGGPSLMQAMAAAFLDDGFEQHLETVRGVYRARRDAALTALEKHMPPGVTWTRPQGGFQLWVTLPGDLSSVSVFLQAIERGVEIQPGPAHDIDGRYASCFRLGFAQATPDEIRTGVERLAAIVTALLSQGARSVRGPGVPV